MEELSKEKKQSINLTILQNEYRNSGRALKGYNRLIKIIRAKNQDKVAWLLRHHDEGDVTEPGEIEFRDQVDFLLKFYSLLEIAILTEYISSNLNPGLQEEIIEVLGNASVKLYYTKHYKVTLPELLYLMIQSRKEQQPIGKSGLFVELLILDKNIDDDVENFLWLLDGGSFGNYGIKGLRRTLKSRKQIEEILSKARKHETYADSAFWGFIKFADYMQRYESLLKKCENELLRSLIWHYQSYWFERMQKLMRDTFVPALQDIQQTNSKVTYKQFRAAAETPNSDLTKLEKDKKAKKAFVKFQRDNIQQTTSTIKSVKYNLNKQHAKPLIAYMKSELI